MRVCTLCPGQGKGCTSGQDRCFRPFESKNETHLLYNLKNREKKMKKKKKEVSLCPAKLVSSVFSVALISPSQLCDCNLAKGWGSTAPWHLSSWAILQAFPWSVLRRGTSCLLLGSWWQPVCSPSVKRCCVSLSQKCCGRWAWCQRCVLNQGCCSRALQKRVLWGSQRKMWWADGNDLAHFL